MLPRFIGKNCFVRWIWSKVYQRYLFDEFTEDVATVVLVKGWRTAVITNRTGVRISITPCFWWFK